MNKGRPTDENRDKIIRKPNKISAFAIRKLTAVVFASTHVQSGSRYALQISNTTVIIHFASMFNGQNIVN